MKNIFTSIDIGSDNIKIVTCELYNNKLNLLAASSIKSKGIRMGIIVNPNEASNSIRTCLNEIEAMLGIEIKKVIVSVPSNFAEFSFIKGDISITNEEGIIKSNDIVEVLQIAMESKLETDKEMVTIIPIDFKIDDVDNVTNPLGKTGKTLSTRGIMVTTPKKNIYSVATVLEDVGVDVIDIMINGIGDINSLKNTNTNNAIGAIVNIGAETINVSLYNKNVIVKNSTIGIGCNEIDKTIASVYKIELKDAKRVKEKFAVASKKFASVSDFIEITNIYNEDIKINQYEVSEICMTKLNDMIDLAKKEIKSLSNHELDYIMFTGGTSMMDHFDNLVNEQIGKIATIGKMHIVGVRNNMYSACVGNIIYFINKLKLKGRDYSMVSSKDMENISSKKSTTISSNSMLGKVVGYFFGE